MNLEEIKILATSPSTKIQIARAWDRMPFSDKLEPSYAVMLEAGLKGETWANIHTCVFAAGSASHAYLEIGCRRGHSIVAAMCANPELDVTGVDIWSTDSYNGEENSQALLEKTLRDLKRNARIINGDSKEILPIMFKQGRRFNLITVDGDHESEPAATDLSNAVKLLAPHGVIIFDDITLNGYSLGRVWSNFKASHPDWEFTEFNWGNGTGVGVSP